MFRNDKNLLIPVQIIFLFLIILLSLTGCGDPATDESTTAEPEEVGAALPEKPHGSISGNINNDGFVATNDGWVYFSIPGDARLIKMQTDGSEKQVISWEEAEYINVIDGWLYYKSDSEIVKLRTDGSERTVIDTRAFPHYLYVVGDWVYYYSVLNHDTGAGLYKVRTDGEEKTLLHDVRALDINIRGEWIYFNNMDDNYRPYKIKIDGTEPARVPGIDAFNLQLHENTLYYSNGHTLHKVSIEGGTSSEINHQGIIGDFIIDDGKIYFFTPTGLYSGAYYLNRLDVNSEDVETMGEVELSEDNALMKSFNLADGWIYILVFDEEILFRVRTDGSDLEEVVTADTEIEGSALAEEEQAGSSNYMLDIPALLALGFDSAKSMLDQHFSEPPTVEGPKEYMGTEFTIYAYADVIEDSLVVLSIGIAELKNTSPDLPFIYIAMGTFEGFPMDYDLEDLYQMTNLDPNAEGYTLDDVEVTDNMITLTVRQAD